VVRGELRRQLALLIVALQEAFTAIVPFFLLTSLIALSRFVFGHFHLEVHLGPIFLNKYQLWQLQETFYRFSSFVAVSAIAYFYARRIQTSPVAATMLAIAVLISCLEMRDRHKLIELPHGLAPITLIAPIVGAHLLKGFSRYLSLSLPEPAAKRHMYRHLEDLFSFLAAYVAALLLLKFTTAAVMHHASGLFAGISERLSPIGHFLVRDLLSHLFWFLGVHGDRVVNGILGHEILDRTLFPHLTFAEFNRLFVVIGGAGVGLALLFALLLVSKNRSLRVLSWISAPFVLFNINTLLIYAVVVFNRFMFLPFVFLPLLNIGLALLFLHAVPIRFQKAYLVWNTPPFLDGYLKSGGDWRLVAFQAFLVALDTVVYGYFVHRYGEALSFKLQLRRLSENLGLTEQLASEEGVQAFVAYTKLIEAHAKLDALLKELKEENLILYYQPIVPLKEGRAGSIEALLRYRRDGRVLGPFFLPLIEEAGLAPVLDVWVAKRVKRDLERLGSREHLPKVSINLHPDTLLNDRAVETILRTLEGENVGFEILERSYLGGSKALRNLRRLREAGFTLSIDDFGSGYSSLDTIIEHVFDELKLDRALVKKATDLRGQKVIESVVRVCHGLDTRVVAEGVEAEEQLRSLCAAGVDAAQGHYFAKARPLEEALALLREVAPACGISGGEAA